jgi:hypothetical protein
MSLKDIEREDEDRVQYEMQLFGQGGKKNKAWPSDPERKRKPKAGPERLESSEDFRLTLETVKR